MDKNIVTASSVEKWKRSLPVNTVDGNPATYWSTDESDPWIQYALQDETNINRIGIEWYNGDKRIYPFEVETTLDCLNWSEVFRGKSRGMKGMEYYKLNPGTARYIRIRCHGNNITGFSAISEVRIKGLKH